MKYHLAIMTLVVCFAGVSCEWDVCALIGLCLCNEATLTVTCNGNSLQSIELFQYFPSDTRVIIFSNNPEMEDLPAEFYIRKAIFMVEQVEFTNNPMTGLTRSSFSQTPRLKVLRITNSQIVNMPSNLLAEARLLEVFELTNNGPLVSIPESLFLGIEQLQTFSLVGSPLIGTIPQRLFYTTSALTTVRIETTGLTPGGVPRDIFDSSESLLIFSFSNNPDLTSMGQTWLRSLPNVIIANVNNNANLNSIEAGSFDALSSSEPKQINLSGNNLTQSGIPDDLFDNITPVSVDFSENPMLTSPPAACSKNDVTCLGFAVFTTEAENDKATTEEEGSDAISTTEVKGDSTSIFTTKEEGESVSVLLE